ncbi:MAG TPA: sugar transferase [Desulfatiglandales bacterium]|nr:sugar transferase [Desulfatiglandales bacterium]
MSFERKKRLLDIIYSSCALVVLSPLIILIIIFERLIMGGNIFFTQLRPGLNGKSFTVYKFRTMTDERDEEGKLLPDGERLTRMGRFLRKTSIDELPEFFNVVKGDMSLVGPQPLLMQYLERYSPEQMRRHDVKPGITPVK